MAQMSFIKGVALVVAASRLDAFILGPEPEKIDALEKALCNLMAVLPHTPLRGIGCNFHFNDGDPSAELLALFESPEGVEGEYVVRARQFNAQLDIDGGVLNFARANAAGSVQFSFNYHRAPDSAQAYADLIPGLINRSREHSAKLLETLYGLTEFESVGFLPAGAEEMQNGQNADEHPFGDQNNGQG